MPLLWLLFRQHIRQPIRKSNIDSIMLLFHTVATLCSEFSVSKWLYFTSSMPVSVFLSQHYTTEASEPNLCDAKGTLQCENYQTCCPFANGEYGKSFAIFAALSGKNSGFLCATRLQDAALSRLRTVVLRVISAVQPDSAVEIAAASEWIWDESQKLYTEKV